MSTFDNTDWRSRKYTSTPGGFRNTPISTRPSQSFSVPGGFRNTPYSTLPTSFTQTPGGQKSGGAVNPLIPGATTPSILNSMTADAYARRAGETTPPPPGPEPMDPYLALLYGFMEQAGQSTGGRSADLSGYNASLKMLAKERKRMKARYKKYEGQIADIYGTLSGINKSMLAEIGPAGEAMRADLAAQESEQAAATRSAEDARLGTATQAREALGLEDLAGQYAGGDVVTQQSENMIEDTAARNTAAENTMLANEAIAKSQLQNQELAGTIGQANATQQLQRSLEDALAAIRAERANVLTARSQAASQGGGGSGPNIGMQMDILQKIQEYTNPQASGEPSALEIFKSRYQDLAPSADQAADTFTEWVANNYNTIPSVKLGKTPDGREVVNTFLSQISTSVPQAEQWARNNNMYNLLVQLASPPRK